MPSRPTLPDLAKTAAAEVTEEMLAAASYVAAGGMASGVIVRGHQLNGARDAHALLYRNDLVANTQDNLFSAMETLKVMSDTAKLTGAADYAVGVERVRTALLKEIERRAEAKRRPLVAA